MKGDSNRSQRVNGDRTRDLPLRRVIYPVSYESSLVQIDQIDGLDLEFLVVPAQKHLTI